MMIAAPRSPTLRALLGDRAGCSGESFQASAHIFGQGGIGKYRTYTDDNRLESTVVGLDAPAQPVLSLGYLYDENRRKIDETDGITATRSQQFGYDDADRLTAWNAGTKAQSWTLSAVGNWTNTTVNGVVENREHTAVHEIAKINNAVVLHDAAGNLARTAQGQGFSWDAENRLLMADALPSDDYKLGRVTYWYDALGRRVAKRVHGSVTRFVHDGWQVIQELNAPYVATSAEAASDGALTSLATVPDGALLYPTFDAEGNRHDPVRVNFQPETTAIPEGFIADKGRAFDTRTNGLSYGWQGATERPTPTIRHIHPLPQFDTFGLVADTSTTWTWQIALPNGTYPVAIVAGDATSLAHTNNLVINGQPLTDPDPGDDSTVPAYEQGDFDGWLELVEVTDGVLTITAGAGAYNPTLCHIEIGAKDQAITPEMQTRLADQILAATQRTGGSPFWNGGRSETRSYVWDPAYIDNLIAYQRTNEVGTSTYYAHSGVQYSVQAVTSETGQVVERYSYDAYGTRTVEGVSNGRSAIGLTTGFTGRALDEETGIYYFRNRMYLGKDGRFVSRDPMGYVDGMSLYRGYFVPGAMDPTGLFHLLARLNVPENKDLRFDWWWTNIQRGNRPTMGSFTTKRQLEDLLCTASIQGTGVRIDTFELWTHGAPDMVTLSKYFTPQDLAQALKIYIKQGSMIILSACNSGNKDPGLPKTYAEILARLIPDANVYGTTGYAIGSYLRGDLVVTKLLNNDPNSAYPGGQDGKGINALRKIP